MNIWVWGDAGLTSGWGGGAEVLLRLKRLALLEAPGWG